MQDAVRSMVQRKKDRSSITLMGHKKYIERLFYNRCSKLRPEVVWQAGQLHCTEFLTFRKIPGMSRVLPGATDIRKMRFFN
ncbi:hypothetical protein TNCV_1297631 [Trichonephila clavipes]|nr:hypothetical protein TNCV_1297631 [Trichonephila clavipes]